MSGNPGVDYEIRAKDKTEDAVNSAILRQVEFRTALKALSDTKKDTGAVIAGFVYISKAITVATEKIRAFRAALTHGNSGLIEIADSAKSKAAPALLAMSNAFEKSQKTISAGEKIENFAQHVKKAVPALVLMNTAMGQSNDAISKTIRAVSSIASAFAVFGPGGAIKAGMDIVSAHFIEKAEKMLETAKRLGAIMTARLSDMKEARMDATIGDLERVAEMAKRSEGALSRMTTALKEMADTKNASAAAKEEGALIKMRGQMAKDVGAADDESAERVASAWRVKIAEKELEIKIASAEREKNADEASLKAAEIRLQLAERNAKALDEAAAKAEKEASQMAEIFGEMDKAYAGSFASAAKAARAKADEASAGAGAQREAVNAARERLKGNNIARANGVGAATVAVQEAKNASAKADKAYAKAAKERAKAAAKAEEQERLKMERRILQERIRAERRELQRQRKAESDASARHSEAQSQARDAWNTFRQTMDPGGRRQLRKEERRAAKEERRFQSRLAKLKAKYGDDLAGMDEAKLSLTERTTRKVAMAREEEKNAKAEAERAAKAAEACEKHLEKLAENIDSGD